MSAETPKKKKFYFRSIPAVGVSLYVGAGFGYFASDGGIVLACISGFIAFYLTAMCFAVFYWFLTKLHILGPVD